MKEDNANLAMQYSEQVIQLGFVTIFAPAFPIGPLFAIIVNAIAVKGEINMYCYYGRRHIAKGASGIGAWQAFIELTSMVAVVVNSALVFYTASTSLSLGIFDGLEIYQKFAIVVLIEHAVIALKMLL